MDVKYRATDLCPEIREQWYYADGACLLVTRAGNRYTWDEAEASDMPPAARREAE